MAGYGGRRSSRGMRNLKSAGMTVAKCGVRAGGKAAARIARWAMTDHSNFSETMLRMPRMGFLATIGYILLQCVVAVGGGSHCLKL